VGAVDVYRITDQLDDATLDVLITRLEARGKHPRFETGSRSNSQRFPGMGCTSQLRTPVEFSFSHFTSKTRTHWDAVLGEHKSCVGGCARDIGGRRAFCRRTGGGREQVLAGRERGVWSECR